MTIKIRSRWLHIEIAGEVVVLDVGGRGVRTLEVIDGHVRIETSEPPTPSPDALEQSESQAAGNPPPP